MEIKNVPNLAHNVAMNQLMLDVLTTAPARHVNNAEAVNKVSIKLDPVVMRDGAPILNQPASQLNRTFEISKDPPTTVLKYTNELTKQVELQIPSEVSLRVYKSNLEFIKRTEDSKHTISIKV